MGQDVAAFDAVLKNKYEGPIREDLNNATNLLDWFEKVDKNALKWTGRVAIVPRHTKRNSGVLDVGENDYIPNAGKQGYAVLQIPMRKRMGRIELTSDVIEQSKSSEGAFESAMTSEKKRIVDDFARRRNIAVAGAGRGIVALQSGAVSGSSITLKNPGGVTGTTNSARYVTEGDQLAIHVGTTAAVRGIFEVLSVDSGNGITFTTPPNSSDGDFITFGVQVDGNFQGSLDKGPEGILSLADNTTYKVTVNGVDRSDPANRTFLANILSNVGTLSRDIFRRATDNTEERGGAILDVFACHYSVRREAQKIAEADIRYMYPANGTANPDPGTKVDGPGKKRADFQFAERPFRVDKDFAYGTIVGADSTHLKRAELTPFEWASDDGTILLRTRNTDAYEGRCRIRENFWTDKGNALLRMDGISATVTDGVMAL